MLHQRLAHYTITAPQLRASCTNHPPARQTAESRILVVVVIITITITITITATLLGRHSRHPLLLVLLVKVQQHAQHRYELLLVLAVALLEKL
ncbi:hypothetical protein COCSADRAFT_39924 [Bipolaris sorokiniana ND90Pr]|uniref:Uncharacterized protein n=1 Tax=Cochliobolus sativus (strain ND90Pr / ATCC 201652) TaxID=665912 RepID=M2S209_COCSN|nr:uncharacterized protein COCSADRAFT_39924 [Bipolaris sorokiniana ND90Pr]EMD61258.1 hypothetical protein COCSADRAFT_39924 [Bipolaris sorokiniana ND90Pr]